MRVCGQQFSKETLDRISAAVGADPKLTRHSLSLQVCQWLNWNLASGKYAQVSCRAALLKLKRGGLIKLPAAKTNCFKASAPKVPSTRLIDVPQLSCQLPDLGEITLVAVSSRYAKSSKIWNDLMDRFHYLGKGPLCGAQIRYLVQSARYGYLGALAFSSATWRLKARDQYIGWSEVAKRANLDRIVCNSRFLIAPGVKVPNLASHVLSRAAGQLGADWQQRYGRVPVLIETFVDPSRFAGTCYRAANWVHVGQTAARSSAYRNGKVSSGVKDIYMQPICDSWQQVLCAEPEALPGSADRPIASDSWAEEEFGTVAFFDERLKKRLYILAEDFFAQPGELVAQTCNGEQAKIKAAYRFFKNPNVAMQTLLKPHIGSSIQRIKSHPVVLAVQDTTTLNYTSHPPLGVGPVNTTKDPTVGLLMHDTMAFTPDGVPLGLLNVQCWARDAKQVGKKYQRHLLPIEEKESFKWLASYRAVNQIQQLCTDSLLVSVADREADIYELFFEAFKDVNNAKVLVRAERTRRRKVEQEHLWPRMGKVKPAGTIEVAVPAKAGQPARTAKVQVRFAKVKLQPPQTSTLEAVSIWAVYAKEINYEPSVKQPIDWMLLTSVETDTFAQACERLGWYAKRWGIELYHRTLKSGCRIQDRRLDHTDNLMACLAIDLVVAWRINWLTMASRQMPDTSCEPIFSADEWRVMSAWATGKAVDKAPNTQQMAHWIGKLGGWLPRAKDDNPGTTCMWRGLSRLPGLVQGYLLAIMIHNVNHDP